MDKIKVVKTLKSTPEIQAIDLRKQLYFNPGIPEKR